MVGDCFDMLTAGKPVFKAYQCILPYQPSSPYLHIGKTYISQNILQSALGSLQSYCRSYRHTVILSFIQSYGHTVILSFIQSYCRLYSHTVGHTVCHTVILSVIQLVILLYCRSYGHVRMWKSLLTVSPLTSYLMWYLDFRSTRGQKVNPALAREVPLIIGMAQSVHLGLIGLYKGSLILW